MPIFGSKEGTPSNGRPGMSAPPAPIRVHHNGGNRPSVPPSSAKIPSSTPLFASMFGISRHKKQNSAPLQTNTTNLPSEYYMDENSNGLQGSYTNGHQKSGTYTSAFHPVGKPPTAVASHSNNHSGLSNNHINRRQSIGGGVEEKQQSTSFFQRLTRRKTPVSISTPSSPASARKHFFSFGSSDNHNRSASNKPVVSKEDVPLANNTRPKSAIPNPQQQQLSFAQRIKLHKGMRTTGKVPFEFMQSSKSQGQLAAQKRQQKDALKREKAFSADALNQMDPVYLTEALLAIGDVQPIVARSIPKHTVLIDDPKKTEERLRRDCLYEDEFYDKMLADSVLVCDLLQTHLSDCIAGVRAKTPTALSSPFTSPPQTPNMSRSQSSQPLFVGNGHVATGRSISTISSGVSPVPVAPNPPHGGRSISSVSSANYGIGYGWKAGALGQFPIGGGPMASTPLRSGMNLATRNVGVRSAAISVAPNTASLPPLSPAMSAAARKKLSTNVHFAS